jgi:hypothetical protein
MFLAQSHLPRGGNLRFTIFALGSPSWTAPAERSGGGAFVAAGLRPAVEPWRPARRKRRGTRSGLRPEFLARWKSAGGFIPGGRMPALYRRRDARRCNALASRARKAVSRFACHLRHLRVLRATLRKKSEEIIAGLRLVF